MVASRVDFARISYIVLFHPCSLIQGDVFLWIEVLSAVGTPRLKDFTTKVADAWMAIKLKVRALIVHSPEVSAFSRPFTTNGLLHLLRVYD